MAKSGGYAFIIEMLLVTLFFSLAAAVLLQADYSQMKMWPKIRRWWLHSRHWRSLCQETQINRQYTGMTRDGSRLTVMNKHAIA